MSIEANELKPLITALSNLTPAPARLDRDGLLHAAGRLAGARAARPWRWTALGLVGISCALVVCLAGRSPHIEERIVVIRVPAATPVTPVGGVTQDAPPTSEHDATSPVSFTMPADAVQLDARWRALRFGVDALPNRAAAPGTGASPPVHSLESDLDLPRDSLKGLCAGRLHVKSDP